MFNGAEFNVNVSKRTLEDLQPYFEQYVKGRLFLILESRAPEVYVPLTD